MKALLFLIFIFQGIVLSETLKESVWKIEKSIGTAFWDQDQASLELYTRERRELLNSPGFFSEFLNELEEGKVDSGLLRHIVRLVEFTESEELDFKQVLDSSYKVSNKKDWAKYYFDFGSPEDLPLLVNEYNNSENSNLFYLADAILAILYHASDKDISFIEKNYEIETSVDSRIKKYIDTRIEKASSPKLFEQSIHSRYLSKIFTSLPELSRDQLSTQSGYFVTNSDSWMIPHAVYNNVELTEVVNELYTSGDSTTKYYLQLALPDFEGPIKGKLSSVLSVMKTEREKKNLSENRLNKSSGEDLTQQNISEGKEPVSKNAFYIVVLLFFIAVYYFRTKLKSKS